jgi:hypothetical protein
MNDDEIINLYTDYDLTESDIEIINACIKSAREDERAKTKEESQLLGNSLLFKEGYKEGYAKAKKEVLNNIIKIIRSMPSRVRFSTEGDQICRDKLIKSLSNCPQEGKPTTHQTLCPNGADTQSPLRKNTLNVVEVKDVEYNDKDIQNQEGEK